MNSFDTSTEHQVDIISSISDLRSSDPVIRESARNALVNAGPRAVVPLLKALKDPSDQVCWETAKALGGIADPSAANALVELLDHPNHDVRWLAAEALVHLGREGLKQVLMALLTKSGSVCVQKGAHHVLSQFAARKSGDFLKPLLEKFNAFVPAVAIPLAALKTLHELQDQETAITKRQQPNRAAGDHFSLEL